MRRVFGIIRPCQHRLGRELSEIWTAQLCGVCLALRDEHGQAARVATNYDGLLVALLVEAQAPVPPSRRAAGRCPLRRMRDADVAVGDSVRLAAAVSLVLAAARVRDHVDDRDGVFGAGALRPAARRLAERWLHQGNDAGANFGFDTAVLVSAVDRQEELEAMARPGGSVLTVTEPSETAVAAAFGHTALLAGKPRNHAPLHEVGRLFGRLAHLLDAVEDYRDDLARGKWNPLAATDTSIDAARAMCVDAALGIELALADVDFGDARLVHRLLIDEVRRAIGRTFDESDHRCGNASTVAQSGGPHDPPAYGYPPLGAGAPGGYGGYGGPGSEHEGSPPPPPRRRRWWRSCGDCFDCCDCCDCCDCS